MKKWLKGHKRITIHLIVFIILVIIIFILYLAGFRITFDPNIISDWDAISAVAEWANIVVSVIMVFVAAYLGHFFELKKEEIISSNKAHVELVRDIEKNIESNRNVSTDTTDTFNEEQIKYRIVKYIEMQIAVGTKSISDFIEKDVETTLQILEDMELANLIYHIGDNSKLQKINFLWAMKK